MRRARNAADRAVRSQRVKLIWGPKSVDGGSRNPRSDESLVPFPAAMSTVVLRKEVSFWEDGRAEARMDGLDVGDPVVIVERLKLDMRSWGRTRRLSPAFSS